MELGGGFALNLNIPDAGQQGKRRLTRDASEVMNLGLLLDAPEEAVVSGAGSACYTVSFAPLCFAVSLFPGQHMINPKPEDINLVNISILVAGLFYFLGPLLSESMASREKAPPRDP